MADIEPDVLDAFSTRTRAVQTRLDRKIDRFVNSLGREPTPRERWRLEREAVIDSRPSKTSADAPSLHQEWTARLVALGTDPESLVDDITNRAVPEEADLFTNGRIGAQAIDALSEQQSTWRAAEITREVARALPTTTASTAQEVVDWVEQLSLEVEHDLIVDLTPPAPGHVPVRRDGRPVTEAAVERILTTSEILAQEDEIVTRAQGRVDDPGQDLVDLADSTLSGVQHEVAAAVAGTRALVLVVGPAGTGKTTALQPAVDRLRSDGRAVFGVTPSATAADVLATDTGVDADTLDKLLIEHRLDRPPDHRFDLPASAIVLVDEAAMVSTPALLELFTLADRQHWRLALIGDPMQFAAVGRSGMFGHLVDTFGAIELDRVHRFADGWERDASLALRQGDSDVVAIYDEHGSIHGGTGSQMRRAALNAWWEAEQAGERAAMMAPTNEAIVRLNLAAQFRRLNAGQLDRNGPTVAVGDHTIHEGDRIATRRNDRLLRTDRGQMVKNRDHWTVDAIHADGSLEVSGQTGSVHLGRDYVAEHVELAYAETSHANQGRTVDRSFLYLDGTTDSRGIYVPLTRGRLTNEAFVVTEGEATAADIVAEAVARTWVDQPAITHRFDADNTGPANDAPTVPGHGPVRSGPELRTLLDRRRDLLAELSRPNMDRADRSTAAARLTELERRRGEVRTAIAAARRVLAESKATLDQNQRPVDRLVHRTRTAAAERDFEATRRSLKTLRPEATEVCEERTRLLAEVRQAKRAAAERPQIEGELRSINGELTADRAVGLDQLDGSDLDLIVDRLGPKPSGPTVRKLWREAAGAIAQHRQAFAIDDDTLLGTPPWDDVYDAYATSHRDAEAAIEDLDRAIGRPLERQGLERPSLSL